MNIARVVEGITLRRVEGGWEGDYAGYCFKVLGPRSTGTSATGVRWSVCVRPLDRLYIVAGDFSSTSLADAVQSVKRQADVGDLRRNIEQWLVDHPVQRGFVT